MSRLTKYEPRKYSMFPYQLKDDELSTKLDSIHKLLNELFTIWGWI